MVVCDSLRCRLIECLPDCDDVVAGTAGAARDAVFGESTVATGKSSASYASSAQLRLSAVVGSVRSVLMERRPLDSLSLRVEWKLASDVPEADVASGCDGWEIN